MRKLVVSLGLSCLGLLAGCSGGSAAPGTGGANSGGPGGQVVLKSLQISPANSSILPLTSKQFTAMGTYSDGSTKDLTSQVSWNSTPNTVSSISDSTPTKGLVHGVSAGVSVITATSSSVVNLTQLTVSSVTVNSIAVTPATANLSLGAQQQFKATATFSDGSIQDVTNEATWSSDTSSVASITARTGLATALTVGSANIMATLGSVSSGDTENPNAKLTVNADNLVSVAVQPGTSSIAVGTKLQFSAMGLFNDGSTRDLTTLATWTSSDAKVATIGPTGLTGPGKFSSKSTDNNSTAITTSIAVPLVLGGTCPGSSRPSTDGSSCVFTGSAGLSVANPTLRSLLSITVTPSSVSSAPGTQTSFTALAAFSDSTTQDLTDQVSWSVVSTAPTKSPDTCNNKTATTTISRLGLATGTGAATCNVIATFAPANFSSNPGAMLTVTSAELTSIAITPAIPVAAPGSTVQLMATGTFNDNSTQDITGAVKWTSSDSAGAVAPVSSSGVMTGEGVGSAFITATFPANSVTLTEVASMTNVLTEPLKSLAITSPSPAFAAQSSMQVTAIGTFADGNTQDITSSAGWSTSPDTVATVSSSAGTAGVVTGNTGGAVTVSATFDGVSATLPLTVATLASITVTDTSSFNISSGSSDQLKATGTLSDGTAQDLTGNVVWSSSKPAVAVVDNNGLASGTGKGVSAITATLNENPPISCTATLTVH